MFDRVVVGAADAEGVTRAVTRAIEVTRVSGGTMHVVVAQRRRRQLAVAQDRRVTDHGLDPDEALLRRFEEMAARESVRIELHPLQSEPAQAIAAVAAEQAADLVVVGSRTAHRHRQLSAVPQAVMDTVPCAVMVV